MRVTAANNRGDRIEIQGGTLSEDRVWDYGKLPIQLANDLRVAAPATLSIAPGTVVKMPRAKFIESSTGTISAIGTAAEPIVFTAAQDDSVGGDSNDDSDASAGYRGFWEAVYLRGPGNVLQNVEVRFAGDTDGDGQGFGAVNAVEVNHGGATPQAQTRLVNVRVSDSYSTGVGVHLASPTLQNVHVEDGGGVAFYFALLASPSASGLTARGNAGDQLLIEGGTLGEDRHWNYGPIPIHLSNDLDIADDGQGQPATLTIAAGTTVKVPRARFIRTTSGTIEARGTAQSPIVFTAAADDSVAGDSNSDRNASSPYAGYWESLYLSGPSNLLEHVQVRYAGDTDGDGVGFGAVEAVQIQYAGDDPDLQTRLTAVGVSDSFSTGIGVLSGAPRLEDVHVSDGRVLLITLISTRLRLPPISLLTVTLPATISWFKAAC